MLPQGAIPRMAVLKFRRNNSGLLTGSLILFATGIGFFIYFSQLFNGIGQRRRKPVFFTVVKIGPFRMHIHNFRNNHSHRRPPVAQMRVGNNLVADKTLNALYGFADDGRTQMADMHFFCHIRRTKIQNDIFRFFDFVAA